MRFRDIYAESEGFLDLRALRQGSNPVQKFLKPDDNAGIDRFFKEHSGSDIYFGVATRDGKGGKKENIVAIPAAWVDIDYKDIDEAKALQKLNEFPLRPTMLTHSGGGLHGYWMFKEPAGKEDIAQVEAINRGLARALNGDQNSTDASRILRPPGTVNHKYPHKPVVTVISNGGGAYSLGDFDYLAEPVDEPAPRTVVKTEEVIHGVKEGERDATLYRYACKLFGRGMSRDEVEALVLLAASRCEPTFPAKDALAKVKQALKYEITGEDVTNVTSVTKETGCYQNVTSMLPSQLDARTANLAQAVEEWVMAWDLQSFSTEDLKSDLEISDKEKNNLKVILSRLVVGGKIKRVTRGLYARITPLLKMEWQTASTEEYPIALPLGLDRIVETLPKNIIVLAGERNSAKTTMMMEIARLNMKRLDTHYFSSEMGPVEFRKRVSKYEGMNINDWNALHTWELPSNFEDKIVPNGLNLIDFLEIHDEFYRVGAILRKIHDKLDNGVAVVAIQKNKDTDVGRGGTMSLEKPRLYVALSLVEDDDGYVHNVAKIVKAKSYRNPDCDPNGMVYRFRVRNGCEIVPLCEGWFRQVNRKQTYRR